MKVKEVRSCSFENWYKTFEDVTIESAILPIPSKVFCYLQDKGTLVVPEESCDIEEHDVCDHDQEWESDMPVASAPDLKEFSQEIRKSIERLGGTAFPKLNWSSPKDAAWISYNKSLQCSSPNDVYLLLKSSDFVTHDLTCPYKDCVDKDDCDNETDYYLVLRKWKEINPSDEFRCFVKDKELIGISQRDTSQFYSSIHKEKDLIVEDIILFWEEHIRNYFHLFSYVFDVHRPKNGSVVLIDFGPFGNTTDGLMFSWEELRNINIVYFPEDVDSNLVEEERNPDVEPELRYVTSVTGVQPSPYSHYGLPVDIIDLSTGQDPLKLVDFLQMKIQKQGEDNSDSEDDNCAEEESSLSES